MRTPASFYGIALCVFSELAACHYQYVLVLRVPSELSLTIALLYLYESSISIVVDILSSQGSEGRCYFCVLSTQNKFPGNRKQGVAYLVPTTSRLYFLFFTITVLLICHCLKRSSLKNEKKKKVFCFYQTIQRYLLSTYCELHRVVGTGGSTAAPSQPIICPRGVYSLVVKEGSGGADIKGVHRCVHGLVPMLQSAGRRLNQDDVRWCLLG